MKVTWLTADHHFGHRRVIEYTKRPFISVEEMDKTMIERWNEVVAPEDLVYHLGDFGFGTEAELEIILARLNGQKFLIRGNHDRAGVRLSGWTGVLTTATLYLTHDTSLAMIHDPAEWKCKPITGHHVILAHGHWHGKEFANPTSCELVDVSVEAREYRPISLPEVIRWRF